MLEYQSRAGGSRPSRDGEEDLSQIAHELLIFVEKIVKFMKQARIKFEKNPGKPKKIGFEKSRFVIDDQSLVCLNFQGSLGRKRPS